MITGTIEDFKNKYDTVTEGFELKRVDLYSKRLIYGQALFLKDSSEYLPFYVEVEIPLSDFLIECTSSYYFSELQDILRIKVWVGPGVVEEYRN